MMELHATFGQLDPPPHHLPAMLQLLWARTAAAFGAMTSAMLLGAFVGSTHGQHSARDASASELQDALARSFCQVYLLVTFLMSMVAMAFAFVTVRQRICPAAPLPRAPSNSWQRLSLANPRDDSLVLVFLSLFLVLQVGNQAAFYQLLFTYASMTPGLDFTIRSAAFITATFWGVLGLSRLLSIYLVHSFSPEQILLVDAIAAVASLSLLASAPTSLPTLWAATAVYAFSFAGMLPASVSLADRAFTLSSSKYALSCIMNVSGTLGEMLLPLILAHFLKEPGPQTCQVRHTSPIREPWEQSASAMHPAAARSM